MTDDWIQKNDISLTEIWRGLGVSVYNTGYIGLGKKQDGSLNNHFYKYDVPSDSWQELNTLSVTPRSYPSYSVIENKLYIYGGELIDGSYSNEFQRIDLELETVTNLNNFPSDARRGSFAFSSNEDFYITTGVTTTHRANETWKSSHVVNLNTKSTLEDLLIFNSSGVNGIHNLNSPVTIQLFTIDGKLALNQSNITENHTFDTDLTGVFIVRVYNDDLNITKRVMINYSNFH